MSAGNEGKNPSPVEGQFHDLIIKEADRQHADDSFWVFYGLYSLNGRNSTSYIFYGLFF